MYFDKESATTDIVYIVIPDVHATEQFCNTKTFIMFLL